MPKRPFREWFDFSEFEPDPELDVWVLAEWPDDSGNEPLVLRAYFSDGTWYYHSSGTPLDDNFVVRGWRYVD